MALRNRGNRLGLDSQEVCPWGPSSDGTRLLDSGSRGSVDGSPGYSLCPTSEESKTPETKSPSSIR